MRAISSEDIWLTEISNIVALGLEKNEGMGPLQKRGSIFPKRDPATLNDLSALIQEMENLDRTIRSRQMDSSFDAVAATRRRSELSARIAVRSAFDRPGVTDRMGRISD